MAHWVLIGILVAVAYAFVVFVAIRFFSYVAQLDRQCGVGDPLPGGTAQSLRHRSTWTELRRAKAATRVRH
jgi:hypothetical protein